MELGIKNKKVLITGSSRGLGSKLAKDFSKEECKIILVGRNKVNLIKTFNEIGGKDNGNSYYVMDLLQSGSPKKLSKHILEKNMGVDIIIHNLGGALGVRDPLAQYNDWKKVWDFNVGVSIQLNNLLIPKMIKNNWGRIVHISSVNAISAGEVNTKYGASHAYNSSKSYLNTYVKSISRELIKKNIVISSVMPGPIMSKGKHWEKLKKQKLNIYKEFINNFIPSGKLSTYDEISPFVLLLSSDKSTLASGSSLKIDGSQV